MGLTILLYGLVVSPLVHAVAQHGASDTSAGFDAAWTTHKRGLPAPFAHDESKPHSHGPGGKGTPHSHREGSVEHLRAAIAPAPDVAVTPVPIGLLAWKLSGEERGRAGRAERLSSMPQGP